MSNVETNGKIWRKWLKNSKRGHIKCIKIHMKEKNIKAKMKKREKFTIIDKHRLVQILRF